MLAHMTQRMAKAEGIRSTGESDPEPPARRTIDRYAVASKVDHVIERHSTLPQKQVCDVCCKLHMVYVLQKRSEI